MDKIWEKISDAAEKLAELTDTGEYDNTPMYEELAHVANQLYRLREKYGKND